MRHIYLNAIKFIFDKDRNTFVMSEREVQFDTSYTVHSLKGNEKLFDFTHSTGPEFDPNTKWIYESEDGIKLEVCNDAEITKRAGEMYLHHKLNRDNPDYNPTIKSPRKGNTSYDLMC